MDFVGKDPLRRDGPRKLTGDERYIDDIDLPGCLHGVTLRSTIAYGRIRAIRFDSAFPWDQCVIAKAQDIPGENFVTLIEKDQPLLASDKIMHPMEPILLMAHQDRALAYAALEHIHVDYETLEPVYAIKDSLAVRQKLFGASNIFKEFHVEKGSLDDGWSRSQVIIEGVYRVPHQEQAYIENNGMAAYIDDKGVLTVIGSLQCPYYVHKALKQMFRLDDGHVRVIQAATGGGFGGKEDYPSLIAGHAALLAMKARRPVKIIYDRQEDMAATTKRHPALIHHKTGLTRDGKLVAQDIDITMDGGAYATLSSVVLSRATLHATGPYTCPNVRVRSRVVATNTPPNGAFRGFGAPQTLFAAELHFEKIAKVLGKDPLALKRANLYRKGSITLTGQRLQDSVGATEVIDRTLGASRYQQKRKAFERWNKDARKPTWRGIGLAIVHHGAGFTGSGEVYLASRAAVSIDKEAKFEILAASTEIGQGTQTVLAQIVADTLKVPLARVDVPLPDTNHVPDSGPTVASRTCMVVGGLLKRAAQDLKSQATKALGRVPKNPTDWRRAARILCGDNPRRRFETSYKKPAHVEWDDATYKGDAYGVYSYGAAAVEVEVDKTTYAVQATRLTTAQDIGKAIHPRLAKGQMIGGLAQGIGYALLEYPIFKDGRMVNAQLTNYIIPTAADIPPMVAYIIEKPYRDGPFGAKGVGELPMDITAPAIAAAIHHATGRLITSLPILPEDILNAMHPQKEQV
ncbi:MAG: xanthine dehydrogenase family protein molybdopterin-binding subunit [Elusimicrobiota bacterium]